MGLTRKSIVMAVGQLIVDKDGVGIVLVLKSLYHGPRLSIGHLEAGPAVPFEGGCLGQATQARHQSAGGHGEAVGSIVGSPDGDGQPVGDQKQTPWGRRLLADNAGHDRRRLPCRGIGYRTKGAEEPSPACASQSSSGG